MFVQLDVLKETEVRGRRYFVGPIFRAKNRSFQVHDLVCGNIIVHLVTKQITSKDYDNKSYKVKKPQVEWKVNKIQIHTT